MQKFQPSLFNSLCMLETLFVSSLMYGYECRVEINAQNHYQVCVMVCVCVCVCAKHIFPIQMADLSNHLWPVVLASADQRRVMGGGGRGGCRKRNVKLHETNCSVAPCLPWNILSPCEVFIVMLTPV